MQLTGRNHQANMMSHNIVVLMCDRLMYHDRFPTSSDELLSMKKEVNRMVYRPDRDGTHRTQFERNKKKIYATQSVCGICGRPVDKKLKYPHPMSKCIDHIIPVAKGGHPSDIDNLQLAHWTCNRQKSEKLIAIKFDTEKQEVISNRVLPQTIDWASYRSK